MPFDCIDQEGNLIELNQEEVTIRVIVLYSLFTSAERVIAEIVWREDSTLADYLNGLPEEHTWVANILGKNYAKEDWSSTKPAPKDVVVVTLNAEGPLLAFIPELVAATGIAAEGSIVVGVISTVIEAGLVLAGGMLLQTLMGTPAKAQSQSSGSNYNDTGPFNTASEGTVLPVVYGTFRMAGNIVEYYVDNGSDVQDQVLYLMATVSEGQVANISDVQFNYQPISNFVRASFDWRPGIVGQAPMPWFADVIVPIAVQQHIQGTLTSGLNGQPEWYGYTTTTEIDRFRLDFQFPNGLFQTSNTGDLEPYYCEIYGQYRLTSLQGTNAPWTNIATGPTWFQAQPTPIAIGSVVLNTNAYCSGLQITVSVTGSNNEPTTPYNLSVQYQGSDLVPPNSSIEPSQDPPYQWRVDGTIPPQTGWMVLGTEVGTITNTPFQNPDGTVSYIPGTITRTYEINNLAISTYNLQFTGCELLVCNIWTLTTTNFDTNYRGTWNVSLPSPTLEHGQYDIQICRKTAESTVDTYEDEIYLMVVNEISDDLINYNRTAYYGIQVLLGGQLTSTPTVTALVQGRLVNIYDRNGGIIEYAWSDNPADVALDILLNTAHQFGIAPSRVDFAGYDNWRQYCNANTLVFNGAFDGQTNVWDALTQVMRVGHAGPALVGLRWSVTIEGPADPVMMFTQDNIIKSTFQNEFTGTKNRANSMEVVYWDESDYYQQHSAFAFDDSIAQGAALVQSSWQAIGIVDQITAQAEAWFQLNLNRYITQSCTFDVFLQAMGCAIGDVVIVQHNMPAWGYSARIKAISGSLVTIDTPVPVNGADDWRMMLMQSAQCFMCATVIQVGGNQVVLSNPSNPSAPPGFAVSAAPPGGGIQNWINVINTQGGAHRVVIDGVDYGINDQQILYQNNAQVLVITTDRPCVANINDTAYVIKNDYLLQAALAAPPAPSDQFDQTLTITNWLTDIGFPNVGDRVLLGENTLYYKPFRVTNITYKTDHVRTIKAIEYNASIYGPYPAPPANQSNLPAAMLQVYNLLCQQSQTTMTGGALQFYANLQWDQPLNCPFGYGGAIVYAALNNSPFNAVATIAQPTDTFAFAMNSGDTAIFKVVAYGTAGPNVSADISSAPTCSLTIGESTVLPTAIPQTSLTAIGGIRQITVSWTMPDDDFIGVAEVWESLDSNLADAYIEFSGDTDTFTRTGLNTLDTRFYWVRTRSIANTYSAFVGPATATTSQLITADLADAIITAAQFAQNLSPVGLYDGIPPNLNATGGVQVIFNEQDGQLYRYNGLTGFTAEVPAVNISGELTAAQIASLNTDQLVGQIETGQLAAGSVLTENLAVGNPSNVIWNSTCKLTTAGWTMYAITGITNNLLNLDAALQIGTPALPDLGSAISFYNGTAASGAVWAIEWKPQSAAGVDAQPGQVWGAGVEVVSPAGVAITIGLQFYDINGNVISTVGGTTFPGGSTGPGTSLADYTPLSVIATAPAGTTSASMFIQVGVTASPNFSNPFVVFSQAQLGLQPPNATTLAAWAPGGVTTISGGCIEAESITANQIAANAITAGAIAANAITAGTIAAGAISGDEIAANTIETQMLATNFALENSAQIGNLTIVGSFNIAAGTVITDNMGDSSVTTFASASLSGDQTTLSFYLTGQSDIREGIATLSVTFTLVGDGEGGPVSVQASQNGSVICTAQTTLSAAQGSTSVSVSTSILLNSGGDGFEINENNLQGGTVTASCILVIFGRAV